MSILGSIKILAERKETLGTCFRCPANKSLLKRLLFPLTNIQKDKCRVFVILFVNKSCNRLSAIVILKHFHAEKKQSSSFLKHMWVYIWTCVIESD